MATDGVKTLERTLELIEELQAREGVGVSELAASMDVAKSSIHSHLTTLQKRGYVMKNKENKYWLDLKFLSVGGAVREKKTIFRSVRPLLSELAEESGESVAFAVEFRGEMLFASIQRGTDAIHTNIHIGSTVPLQSCPSGKLILSFLPE